jgi:TonB family protein
LQEVFATIGRQGELQLFVLVRGITPPRTLLQTLPHYSDKAKLVKWGGTVKVSFVINAEGNVEEEQVVRPLGLGLDEEALAAAHTWKFEPARQDRKPVPVRVTVGISFHME